MGRKTPSRRAVVFGSVGVVAAVYELVAIVTDDVPTITELITALPMFPRIGLVGLVLAATWDHFISRRWL